MCIVLNILIEIKTVVSLRNAESLQIWCESFSRCLKVANWMVFGFAVQILDILYRYSSNYTEHFKFSVLVPEVYPWQDYKSVCNI